MGLWVAEGVSLSKLQMELLVIGLKQAKGNVDKLLNDEPVTLEFDDLTPAKEFLRQAESIGARGELVIDDV